MTSGYVIDQSIKLDDKEGNPIYEVSFRIHEFKFLRIPKITVCKEVQTAPTEPHGILEEG